MTRLHVCGYKPLLGTFIQFLRDMTRLHVCGYITFTRDFIQFVRDMTRLHVCGYITTYVYTGHISQKLNKCS
jgi:hypothetical protein